MSKKYKIEKLGEGQTLKLPKHVFSMSTLLEIIFPGLSWWTWSFKPWCLYLCMYYACLHSVPRSREGKEECVRTTMHRLFTGGRSSCCWDFWTLALCLSGSSAEITCDLVFSQGIKCRALECLSCCYSDVTHTASIETGDRFYWALYRLVNVTLCLKIKVGSSSTGGFYNCPKSHCWKPQIDPVSSFSAECSPH